MWNKYKSWFEAFDILSFKILPTSENCLSLDKWKKSSPPLTYLQKCKLENTSILDIERNLLHNKAQPVGGGERVFEALRDFFWRPTTKECDGLLLRRIIFLVFWSTWMMLLLNHLLWGKDVWCSEGLCSLSSCAPPRPSLWSPAEQCYHSDQKIIKAWAFLKIFSILIDHAV